jgi:hypothetical protein
MKTEKVIIEKAIVERIIKEEALKIKKLIALKEEKENITKQLNELYESDNIGDEAVVEEGVSREEALKLIMSHPTKGPWFNKLKPEFKEKYLAFVQKNPQAKYAKWDKTKGEFVDAGVYTAPDILSAPGKFAEGINEEKNK